jgi:DNA-directed RNA polymerase specialized sigma24 family protein
MSSAVPTDSLCAHPDPKRVFFWISPVDKEGFRADTAFVEAAYDKANDFRLYRWQELTDEAVRADLVEKAVYAASRAQRGDSVRDPKGYVFTAFTRLVDAHITREDVVTPAPASELEQLQIRSAPAKSTELPDLDRGILRGQILKVMPPEDRWAWERRLAGYEVQEIAADLNISPDCLSTRMRRAAKEAARVLRLGSARQ